MIHYTTKSKETQIISQKKRRNHQKNMIKWNCKKGGEVMKKQFGFGAVLKLTRYDTMKSI